MTISPRPPHGIFSSAFDITNASLPRTAGRLNTRWRADNAQVPGTFEVPGTYVVRRYAAWRSSGRNL